MIKLFLLAIWGACTAFMIYSILTAPIVPDDFEDEIKNFKK